MDVLDACMPLTGCETAWAASFTEDPPSFLPLEILFAEYDAFGPLLASADTPLGTAIECSLSVELTVDPIIANAGASPLLEALRGSVANECPSSAAVPVQASCTSSGGVSTSCGSGPDDSSSHDTASEEEGARPQGRPGSAAVMCKPSGWKGALAPNSRTCSWRGTSSAAKRRKMDDGKTLSGVLQPFDAVKKYGETGSMTLQQLNDRLKGSWKAK